MKKIYRGTQIIVADSKEWAVTSSNYLPGRVITVIYNKCGLILKQKKVKKSWLGNWSAIALEHKGKHLELINMYRLPRSSSNGVYCSLTQYNLEDGKIKSITEYRREILEEIKRYVNMSIDISDIIIAGDYNQSIGDKEVRQFYAEIGICDIHHKINNIPYEKLDKTYKHGSSIIDSITASSRIMQYIEGCKLLEYNEIVESDHRVYMIDITIDEYFQAEFSEWDNINKVMLNPARRSHRERFIKSLGEQLNLYQLEDDLERIKISTTHHQIE